MSEQQVQRRPGSRPQLLQPSVSVTGNDQREDRERDEREGHRILRTRNRDAMSTEPETQARSTIERYVEAWNGRDLEALSSLLHPYADFVNIFGQWQAGRAEILAAHREVFDGFLRDSALELEECMTRAAGDAIITQALWRLTGAVGPDGSALPPIHGRQTAVHVPSGDRLALAAVANTQVAELPG